MVARRRVQTVVVFCVLVVAAAAGVLGLTLATSAAEFSSTFAGFHGAHLAVTIDSAEVSSARLAATRRLPGVARAAAPTRRPLSLSRPALPAGRRLAVRPGRLAAAPVPRPASPILSWARLANFTLAAVSRPAEAPAGRRRGRADRGGPCIAVRAAG